MRKLVATLLLLSTTTAFAALRDPVVARHGMVASTSGIASHVGIDIMKKGGNAVDAAVAVALAMAVTWPAAGNLGGGGFMLIRNADGTSEAIDYRERAPLAASRDMYIDANGKVIKDASTNGYKAIGVPGTVGERFRQPELAATLARIQANPRDFYDGVTARRIVADMRAHGGLITMKDLREYEPTIRKPLHGSYRGHEFIVMPPPSSGGIAMIEMLQMLEKYDLASTGWQSARYLHLITEVMRRAFADRAEFLGDPDFVKQPVSALISPAFAEERRKTIDLERASSSKDIRAGDPVPFEKPDTTHFSIVDADGSMVSNTYTLNDWFGAGVTAKGTGILLNDEMDDFTAKPGAPNDYQLIQSEKNAIAPKKRPLSSMVPLI